MNKIKLLSSFIMCLLLAHFASAQFVSIPDANLRNVLKVKYPSCFNATEELDTICAQDVTDTLFYFSYKQIANLQGVHYFKNVRKLFCLGNQLTSLPTLPSNLTTLECSNNQIATFAKLPENLLHLSCRNNMIVDLDTLPANLKTLNCARNQLSSLPTLPETLTQLLCTNNPLTCVSVLPTNLTSLNVDSTSITCIPNKPQGVQSNHTPVCNSFNNPNQCAIPTSLAEKAEAILTFYPNPAENNRTLVLLDRRGASVKLYSLAGKELADWQQIEEQIILPRLNAGIYLLEVRHEGKRSVVKLAVN